MTVSPEASGLRKIVPPEELEKAEALEKIWTPGDGKAPVPPPPEFKAVPLGEDEDFYGPEAQTRPDIVPKGNRGGRTTSGGQCIGRVRGQSRSRRAR